MMREAALVVEVAEVEQYVGELRLRHDPVAARGVPAHVTALFPFVPPDDIDDEVVRALEQIAAEVAPFEFELTGVDEFPGVVWLRPTPDEPFRRLTARIVAAFPDHPPYGGRYPDTRPHLTIGHTASEAEHRRLLDLTRAAVAPHLPIRCTATGLSAFVSDDRPRWERRHTFAFAG